MLKPNIIDIIPNIASAESEQNSEPSLAVDPFDPGQMIAGAFGSGTPYFKTVNSGTTWSRYGNLDTDDKSLAWKQDGSAALTATLVELTSSPTTTEIRTYSGTSAGSNFGSPIQTFNPSPSRDLDQPWMRTGPSNHVYVTYNDLTASPKTASVLVSTDGGSHYTSFTLDRVGGSAPSGFAQDAPTVRSAANGNTVYAVFTRWNTVVENDSDGARLGSQVVIVRSDDGGADGFTAFGTGDGVQVATTTCAFPPDTSSPTTPQTPLTLGQERIGGDAAIAVDPHNAMHVVVAYGNAPGADHSGELQLVVTESTDGGMNWTQKFSTPAIAGGIKSALPALSILQNGTIGLLYASYDPASDKFSQHLLTTTNDFATTIDTTLATESNVTPVSQFDPYLGDFYDMTSVGDTFYGIFSASNADNGTDALFSTISFQRNFTGTPGTASFHLTDANGSTVPFSIDPFLLSLQILAPSALASPSFQLSAFGSSAGGWSSDDTYPRELADVNGDGRADIIGFSSAGVYESLAAAGGQFAAPTFELAAFGVDAGGWSSDNTYPRELADVSGDTRADIIAFSSAGVYESLATAGGHFAMPTFELAAFGTNAGGWSSDDTYPRELADVNGDGMADIVGFSSVGVYESLATAGGHFAAPTFELAAFGTNAGGWSSDNTYPRALADVNGDGMADIVGFGQSGVYVSLATGGGHFAAPAFELAAFGVNAGGWTSDDLYPRTLADVNADGMADIVGFGADGVYVALATGGGQFASPTFQLSALSPNAGGWSSNNTYPRELADVNGDHVADILGFASNGVWETTTQVGPPTTTTEFPLPTPGASPFSIALGSDGNVWFTEVNGNKIGKISPTGAITEFSWHGLPGGMTAGPDGALWFTEIGDNKIGSITTAGLFGTEFTIPTAGAFAHQITTGPDGALWFAEAGADKIGRITTAGQFSEFSIPTAGGAPFGIAAGPDGNVWFTEIHSNKIGRITTTPDHTITEFTVGDHPSMITAGPAGSNSLWFSESDVEQSSNPNKIGTINTNGTGFTEFSPPTAGSKPQGITVGSDGALWFAEEAANKIGRVTTDGHFNEFALPTAGSAPFEIVSGLDGHLWVTEFSGNAIGDILHLSPPVI
jgi:streptogramin lyase